MSILFRSDFSLWFFFVISVFLLALPLAISSRKTVSAESSILAYRPISVSSPPSVGDGACDESLKEEIDFAEVLRSFAGKTASVPLLKGAIASYRSVLESCPESSRALLAMGRLCSDFAADAQANAYYRRYLALNPMDFGVLIEYLSLGLA